MSTYLGNYGPVCLLFLKTVFSSRKQEQGKYGFQFVFSEKHKKTPNLKNKEEFSENTFLVFFVFSKTGTLSWKLLEYL